ncbi:MAG TPA: hypothetical protein DIT39_03765 [Tissierellales bacterium]|nr:hypothetical protein [Tissierellales bacterium]
MTNMKIDLIASEEKIMAGLKDFQRTTVERVFELFTNGQNRVLVADEVGLGKTLVAKGVIVKTARYHHEQLNDEIFKVVYICSNQNIANQNINKLKINDDITVDGVSDTRLSMQHLKIFEQENDPIIRDKYVQLIPLTPSTSFTMTSGCGSLEERALIFSVLRRLDVFEDYLIELETILIDTATSGWRWAKPAYEHRVAACNELTKGAYIDTLHRAIEKYSSYGEMCSELISLCIKVRNNGNRRVSGTYNSIYRLRMLFAQISVDLLNPDLVVMDEFQRFKYLISANETSETGMLANRFLKGNGTKVLLLSATPYKLYSTLEEINENQLDEHYSEFLQVVEFLFDDEKKQREFKQVWNDFSGKLRTLDQELTSLSEAKYHAEEAMYQGICRTERISAIDSGDFIDDSSVKSPIKVTERDILSFIEAEALMKSAEQRNSVPVDYVKSSPYIMSFMKHYKIKKQIESYFHKNPDKVKLANKKNLWINNRVIRDYGKIDTSNGRLEKLKERVFCNNSEMLLWIPPSIPYYEPQGVFNNCVNFSKTLVFSSWEMVPRMIAGLISYEAERTTVGKLVANNKDKQNTSYFSPNNKRFPVARLRFSLLNDNPQNMSLFCLLYPSKFLAQAYRPVECLNNKMSLKDIETVVSEAIKKKLNELDFYRNKIEYGREDERWYYLAPLFLDEPEYVSTWLEYGSELMSNDLDEEDKGQKGFKAHLQRLHDCYTNPYELNLGKVPDDLIEVLTDIAIASPATCSYRSNGENPLYSSQLAKIMINQFNKPESTAVVDLCYSEGNSDAHWRNTLSYCKDGNFQAVLDEYIHMLVESNGLSDRAKKHEHVHQLMINAMQTHSASYTIDTYSTFKNKINKKRDRGISLRSHFAVGFHKSEGESSKVVNRKESIRNSFNSPFRPFVLATTSIGQEGLDFHYYCRNIMHWNLPSNPIDLEQREGRINRFKCHAIRQNIAKKYSDAVVFEKDIWYELFNHAKLVYQQGRSELVPFWCLPEDQEIKIERLVPVYPLSKDIGNYERLIKILSLYRLTLGQARQEELLEYVFQNYPYKDELKKLFINLSPYYRK